MKKTGSGRWRTAVRAAATALLSLAFAIGLGVAPATAHVLDGTDPVSTGCVNGSYSIYSSSIKNSSNVTIGQFDVRYSPSCGTNWVRVNNYGYGVTAEKLVAVVDGFAESENDNATGWSYSMQVYAPGSTCIEVYGAIRNGGTVIGSTGLITLC